MSANAKDIENEALKLKPEDRANLADKLWLSLEPQSEIDAAWSAEIEKRIREIDTGAVEAIAHEDVVAELRARYGR